MILPLGFLAFKKYFFLLGPTDFQWQHAWTFTSLQGVLPLALLVLQEEELATLLSYLLVFSSYFKLISKILLW